MFRKLRAWSEHLDIVSFEFLESMWQMCTVGIQLQILHHRVLACSCMIYCDYKFTFMQELFSLQIDINALNYRSSHIIYFWVSEFLIPKTCLIGFPSHLTFTIVGFAFHLIFRVFCFPLPASFWHSCHYHWWEFMPHSRSSFNSPSCFCPPSFWIHSNHLLVQHPRDLSDLQFPLLVKVLQLIYDCSWPGRHTSACI